MTDASAPPSFENVLGQAGRSVPLPTVRAARGIAACGTLVAAGVLHPLLAWIGFGGVLVIVVALVVEWAALPAAQDFVATRLGEASLPLGADADVSVEIRLRSGVPDGAWTLTVIDDLDVRIARKRDPAMSQISTSAAAHFTTRVAPQRRGRFVLGTVHARVLGRLGLAERELRFDLRRAVRVVPGLAETAQAARILRRAARAEAGLRRARRRGTGTSFESLREYVQGDDPRHVDWKSSARHEKLITRLYEVERSQSIVFLLDAGRWMTAEVEGLSRFDRFLNASLLLAQVAARRDDRVGALVFDDNVRAFVPPSKGRGAVEGILSAVLDVHPRLVESDYRRAFSTLATRHRKRSMIVIFTDVLSRDQSRILIEECTRSGRRHLPLVVTLRDVGLDRIAEGIPSNASAAYEQAAAEDLLHERDQALATMRAAGVHVVDVPPAQLAAAVVDRYLELKARLLL